jgi:hypothetical protein
MLKWGVHFVECSCGILTGKCRRATLELTSSSSWMAHGVPLIKLS